jgi:hypothetical protein
MKIQRSVTGQWTQIKRTQSMDEVTLPDTPPGRPGVPARKRGAPYGIMSWRLSLKIHWLDYPLERSTTPTKGVHSAVIYSQLLHMVISETDCSFLKSNNQLGSERFRRPGNSISWPNGGVKMQQLFFIRETSLILAGRCRMSWLPTVSNWWYSRRAARSFFSVGFSKFSDEKWQRLGFRFILKNILLSPEIFKNTCTKVELAACRCEQELVHWPALSITWTWTYLHRPYKRKKSRFMVLKFKYDY